ncbi:MAG: hypothetical protein UR15_C0001G0030 [Parcubacteria group bacterium GW2011_GWA2_31_28]|nr:MAG: hypothetical protein UR15_C0001G0030 [Parcubacteria group bacterium GW2011_GWA2_31_28]
MNDVAINDEGQFFVPIQVALKSCKAGSALDYLLKEGVLDKRREGFLNNMQKSLDDYRKGESVVTTGKMKYYDQKTFTTYRLISKIVEDIGLDVSSLEQSLNYALSCGPLSIQQQTQIAHDSDLLKRLGRFSLDYRKSLF